MTVERTDHGVCIVTTIDAAVPEARCLDHQRFPEEMRQVLVAEITGATMGLDNAVAQTSAVASRMCVDHLPGP